MTATNSEGVCGINPGKRRECRFPEGFPTHSGWRIGFSFNVPSRIETRHVSLGESGEFADRVESREKLFSGDGLDLGVGFRDVDQFAADRGGALGVIDGDGEGLQAGKAVPLNGVAGGDRLSVPPEY